MTDAVHSRYRRFADEEAPGRSELYAEWADGVAGDAEVQGVLARIPETRRQPTLVFAVSRMLGAPLAGYDEWRRFVLARADALVAECGRRQIQANEPLRLSPLLPALAEIDGPIALLELGAAAGLCLYPDRFSYRFLDPEGRQRLALDPVDGPSPVVLESTVRGDLPPVRMPEVVWRAGIDLAPLDARDDGDRRWLLAQVWPGEEGRAERIAAALDVAASDPPRLVAGDAGERLHDLASEAPEGVTLVVTTPGVLVHIPRDARRALVEQIRSLPARWVTIDPPWMHESRRGIDSASWPDFVVSVDGEPRASADPLGRWWEWRAGESPSAS